ncbi:MAG: hypothetical protein RLZZ524_913, partial [Pseudomonadota bacterium]
RMAEDMLNSGDPERIRAGLRAVGWWVASGRDTSAWATHDRILQELGNAFGDEVKLRQVISNPANQTEIDALHQDLLARQGAIVKYWMGGVPTGEGNERFGIVNQREFLDANDWSANGKLAKALEKWNKQNGTELVMFHFEQGNEIIMSLALTPEQREKWNDEIVQIEKAIKRPLTSAERMNVVHKVPGVGMQPQMVLSAERTPLVIPRRWVDAIEREEKRAAPPGPLVRAQGRLSAIILRNPLSAVKWLMSQATSNLQMMMTQNPQALNPMVVGRAIKLVSKFAAKRPIDGAERAILDEALRLGVIRTGMTRSVENLDARTFTEMMQMGEQMDMPFYKRFGHVLKNVATGDTAAMDVAVAITDDAPKLALYMQLRGKSPEQIIKQGYAWGISSKAMLERMYAEGATAEELAAKIAREATGDYLATSPMGTTLARTLAPFYRWVEASSFVAVRQLLNLRYAITAPSASTAIGAGYKLSMLAATSGYLIHVANKAMWGDDEAERMLRSGGPPSLIVGRRADGRVITVPFASVMADVASRFGLHDALWNDTREVSPQKMTSMYSFKMLDQLGSLPKAALKATTGLEWNSFQNTFRQAPVQNAGEAAALALETIGLRMVARQVDPSAPSQPYSLHDLYATSRFTEEINFFAGRKVAHQIAAKLWPEEGYDIPKNGPKPTGSDLLFRDTMAAVRAGDEHQAISKLSEYFTSGKQYENFDAALRARGVLNGFSKAKIEEILASATPEQRRVLEDAERAYLSIAKSPLLDRALGRALATNQQKIAYTAAKYRALMADVKAQQAQGVPVDLADTQRFMEAKDFMRASARLSRLRTLLASDPDRADYAEAIAYLEDYLAAQ